MLDFRKSSRERPEMPAHRAPEEQEGQASLGGVVNQGRSNSRCRGCGGQCVLALAPGTVRLQAQLRTVPAFSSTPELSLTYSDQPANPESNTLLSSVQAGGCSPWRLCKAAPGSAWAKELELPGFQPPAVWPGKSCSPSL